MEERAILLFYHYGAVASDELAWQTEQCERLGLKGRLRIAPKEGLNGTLSGLRAALTEYTALVDARVGAARIDWKFGSAEISQCFAELSVREVSEVVSLGVDVPLAEAGAHLDAADFHAALSDGAIDLVVIDARNVYESRIGRFAAPGVETLCPNIRQFSDLPRWIESVLPQIAHKKVLMYCTGGVRCESASAFLRTRGDAHRDVCQLRGGIERYLERYPEGGHWVGRSLSSTRAAPSASPAPTSSAAASAATPRPTTTPPSRGARSADSSFSSALAASKLCQPPNAAAMRAKQRRRNPTLPRSRRRPARLGGCGCSASTASDSRAHRSAAASRSCDGSSAPWPI